MQTKPFALAVTLSAFSLLAACGGGGGTSATTSSVSNTPSSSSPDPVAAPKSVSAGQITGFGSVIVEGFKFEDTNSVVVREDDASSPTGMSKTELALGMKVLVKSKDGKHADSITVSSEVLGKITSLAADGFVVVGQTIKISTDAAAPTVYEGVADLAGLAVGDFVEVHGSRDANQNIVATRIERKDPSLPWFVKVVGTVSGLDAGKSFKLGGLTVNLSTATKVTPTSSTLANGQQVQVWSSASDLAAGILTAKRVHIKAVQDASGAVNNDELRVGGPLRDLNFALKTFKVDGLSVDASSATYVNGSASDLANARRVRVLGTFANGVVKASTVTFVKNQGDALADLSGSISDFVSSASFKVRGVPVDASAATVTFTGGTTADLANGAVIRVQGSVDNNVVKATAITFAAKASNLSGSGLVINELEGGVYEFNAQAGTFKVNGTVVKVENSTVFQGLRTNLANGVRVEVYGTLVNGVLVASKVELKNAAGEMLSIVRGQIADFLGVSNFKVGGQVIDASAAKFGNGPVTGLANGRLIEVRGIVSGGTLVATQVEFR